jgi:hypothetical protein
MIVRANAVVHGTAFGSGGQRRRRIEPFEDAHISIRADSINQTFSGSRRSANWRDRADRPRAFESSSRSTCDAAALVVQWTGSVRTARRRRYGRKDQELFRLRIAARFRDRTALEEALDGSGFSEVRL